MDIFVLYFLFKCKSLVDFTNLFSPNNFKDNNKFILNIFFEFKLMLILLIKVVEIPTYKTINMYPKLTMGCNLNLRKSME